MRISDWSSDVCSSDLVCGQGKGGAEGADGNGKTDGPRCDQRRRQRRQGYIAHDRPRSGAQRVRGFGKGFIHGLRRCRSEEQTSELQSLMRISYAVFGLKKKKTQHRTWG